MKKGRKSKGKDNQINFQTEKRKKISVEQKSITLEEQSEQILFMKIGPGSTHSNNFKMRTDSENFSIEERSEAKNYSKKQLERIFERTGDNNSSGQISGPITRRKEHQNMQLAGKIQNEKSVSEMNNLLKFDEYYKERKNVENVIYFYHPPRISQDLYQASIKNIDTDICLNTNKIINENTDACINYFFILGTGTINERSVGKEDGKLLRKDITERGGMTRLFEYEKISKEDLNYYLKFAAYYKETFSPSISGNVILKGAHSFEQNALNLLRESSYNINLAMRKILFPVIDLMEEGEDVEMACDINYQEKENIAQNLYSGVKRPLKDPMIYVNSALNDLIGSNIQEKQEWLQYVEERLNSIIDFNELQILLELGSKMKIDIPDFVTIEIEKSFSFASIVRRHLTQKNSLNDIINLLEQSKQFKVRTEELQQLEEILKKSNIWLNKIKEQEDKTIHYKTLQSLYQDAKSLPVKFEQYDLIKSRYMRAQKWQEKYQILPKHSKTRQQGISAIKKKPNSKQVNEKCTVNSLQELAEESKQINFTSNDVVSLNTNLDKLIEAESKIVAMLENPNTSKTKELLTEFVNILDNLKFATELYDIVVAKLEFLEWQEKKDYYMSNKVLKMKHLRNLIRDANQKNLNILPEIQSYQEIVGKIETWMEKMADILYCDDKDVGNVNAGADLVSGNKLKPELLSTSNTNDNIVEAKKLQNGCANSFDNENITSSGNEPVANSKRLNKDKQKTKLKIDVSELYDLYKTGKYFEIMTEEIEHLLNKCEEFFEFYEECKLIKNQSLNMVSTSCSDSKNSLSASPHEHYQCNYQKLITLRKQITLYNIKCEEFDLIDSQISLIQKWIEDYLLFITKLDSTGKNFLIKFFEFDTLEQRKDLVQMLEYFLEHSETFYEDLTDLMVKVPQFAKYSKEYLELQSIKENAERVMNGDEMENSKFFETEIRSDSLGNSKNTNAFLNINTSRIFTLEEIQNFIVEIYILPIKKDFFKQILALFKSRSWSYIASSQNKKTLSQAESMLKESFNLILSNSEIETIKEKLKAHIIQTKEWIKQSKEPFCNRLVSYDFFLKIVKDGANLPLITNEYEDLLSFKETLDIDILDSQNFLNTVHHYSDLSKFYEKINYTNIEVPEFETIIKLKTVCDEWRKIAQRILNERKHCQLFFKKNEECGREKDVVINKNNIYNDKLFLDEYNSSEVYLYKMVSVHCDSDTGIKNNFLEKDEEINIPEDFSSVCSKADAVDATPIKNMKFTRNSENFSPKENQKEFLNLNINKHDLENANIKIVNNNYYIQNSSTIKGNNIEISSSHNNQNNFSNFKSKKKQKKLDKENFSHNVYKKRYTSTSTSSKAKKQNLNQYITPPNKGFEKHEAKITVDEYYNIGPIPNPTIQNKNNTTVTNPKYRLAKFNSLTFEEKLKFISETVILKEDNIDEKYCICRRGDDSINYMIMCENCQEWFHGVCLGIPKSAADNIPQYLCLLCERRKDSSTSSYHHSRFTHGQRVSYEKFLEFLTQGESLPVIMDERNVMEHFRNKIEKWYKKYDKLIGKIIDCLNCKSYYVRKINDEKKLTQFKFLDQTLEKNLIDLYLESEGLPVEIEPANNIVIILKQYDWFRDAYKCLENKKFSEKLNKRIILQAYPLFNKEVIHIKSFSREIENNYFSIIIEKGIKVLKEISKIYEKKVTIFTQFRSRFVDKKSMENLEDIIAQIDHQNNMPIQCIIDQITDYVSWVDSVENILTRENFDENIFENLVNKAKSFVFKSELLEKFKRIVLYFNNDQLDIYRSVMFDEKKCDKIMVKNVKKSNVRSKKINSIYYYSEDEEN